MPKSGSQIPQVWIFLSPFYFSTVLLYMFPCVPENKNILALTLNIIQISKLRLTQTYDLIHRPCSYFTNGLNSIREETEPATAADCWNPLGPL